MQRRIPLREWISASHLRLYLICVLAVVLPVTLYFYSVGRVLRQQLEREALQEGTQLSHLSAILVEEHFQNSILFLESYARRRSFQSAWTRKDFQEVGRHLEQAYQLPEDFIYVGMHDPDGTLRAVHPPVPGLVNRNFAFRDWYRGVSRSWTPYVSEVFQTAAPPYPLVVAVAVPMKDEEGKVMGILVATFKLDTIGNWVRRTRQQGPWTISVVDKRGHLLTHPSMDVSGPLVDVREFEPVRRALAGEAAAGVYRRNKEDLFVAFLPVRPHGWGVLAEMSVQVVRQTEQALNRNVLSLGLVFMGLALVSGWLLASFHRELADAQKELRKLNWSLEEKVQERTAALTAEIADRERAEDTLKASESKYRLLFESNPEPMWVYDRDTLAFFAVNRAAVEQYGYARGEFLRMTIKDIRPSEDVPGFLADIGRRGAETDRSTTTRHRRKDGALFDAEVVSHGIEWGGRPAQLVLGRDITERKQAEDSLRQLSGRLLRLQDEERKRIARDLHDSTAQNLASLAIHLSVVNKAAGALDPAARKALSESTALAEQSSCEIRTLSYLLHPPLLDEVGLASALREFAEGFTQRSAIRLDLHVPPEFGRLSSEAETALFRIAQESLSNVHRHSGSSSACIHLFRDSTGVTLEVKDAGRGMLSGLLENTGPRVAGLGVGIAGMRERLRQLGGRLEVHSDHGGTIVRAHLPIPGGNS